MTSVTSQWCKGFSGLQKWDNLNFNPSLPGCVSYLLLSLLLMLWTAALSLSRLTVEANTVDVSAGSRSMTETPNRQPTGPGLVFSLSSVGSLLRLIRFKLRGICLSALCLFWSHSGLISLSDAPLSLCWSLCLSPSPSLAHKHSQTKIVHSREHIHTHFLHKRTDRKDIMSWVILMELKASCNWCVCVCVCVRERGQ